MRSSFIITIVLMLMASAAAAATHAPHHRPTATVVPGCPSPNTQAAIPPLGKPNIAPDIAQDGAPVTAPITAGNSTCPATGSDAQTNIARGHALAKPEPLNSPTLITPRH